MNHHPSGVSQPENPLYQRMSSAPVTMAADVGEPPSEDHPRPIEIMSGPSSGNSGLRDEDFAGLAVEPPVAASAKACRRLQQRWFNALRSVRKLEAHIRRLSANGGTVPPEAWPLAENLPSLRAKFREARGALRGESIRKLPWISGGGTEVAPRVYWLARRFFETSGFSYDEEALVSCLDAVQARQALNIDELWAMKPVLQIVLLEEIGLAADTFISESGAGRPATADHRHPGGAERLVLSIQGLEYTQWDKLFEQVSAAEKILGRDPARVYSRMDAESRDAYRQAVVELAARSGCAETTVAEISVALSERAEKEAHEDGRMLERKRHVGYYLVDEGRPALEDRILYKAALSKKIEKTIFQWPELYYVIAIEAVTIGLIAFILSDAHYTLPFFAALALLLLPAAESAVQIVNQLVSFLIRPRRLPKLDFSGGIPEECASMVVVPTLLLSEAQVRETVEALEIRYLANASRNLHFALLTDSPDSARPLDENDERVSLCAALIEGLNQRYAHDGAGSFFMFHRHRIYNPIEGAWMGWERKRGKLLDLNNLLRGKFDSFPLKIGDLSVLPSIRYVITLDSDTQLPRDAAQALIGALAHPLNRAIIDPATNTVVKGYGILQPRVGISVRSVTRSRLASIYSGQTGFDLYTHATSDVYQDIFKEGSFTGKGIYEVDVYQKVLGERFPTNALLSHDLVEGSYARAGLVSDIEVVDDYPSHFSAYSRRKHRWVRGDWQILRWLLNRVPGYSGELTRNPLSFISRWKILDNLRRSLVEAATLALLLGGWLFLPGGALYWTIATLVLMVAPSYLQLLLSLAAAGHVENWRGFLKEAIKSFATEQMNVLLALVFLLHQTLMVLDAIIRTLIRTTMTHRKLLEWETAAQSELKSKRKSPVEICLDLTPWVSILIGAAIVYARPASLPVALPFLAAWACSRFVCQWLDLPLPSPRNKITPEDEGFLREAALRTWRFFREWSGAGNGWLIPDYVQESPQIVANVISPTNLGLLLNARIAAYDLGYLTLEEFADLSVNTIETMSKFPRIKGHFLNWTRIDGLQPIEPLFISSVDSGNLAASLWTLKQACLEMAAKPVFQESLWRGLRDHLHLAVEARSEKRKRSAIAGLQDRFAALGNDPAAWMAALPEIESSVTVCAEPLSGETGWWLAELRNRLSAVRKIAEDLSPWLLPDYAPLLQALRPDSQPDLERLRLDSLPAALGALSERLRDFTQGPRAASDMRASAASLDQRLCACRTKAAGIISALDRSARMADEFVSAMDFKSLLDSRRQLLSVGYNVAARKLERSCYDLLASEARTATFIAVAKGDIQQQSWFRLGRPHTRFQGERVLLSWSGTLFEYLMPAMWMKTYPETILGMSQQAVVRCQEKMGRRRRRPWGASEAACSRKDAAGNYQYQAFGIPSLALKPGVSQDVVAPYAAMLALEIDSQAAVKNLRRMKRMGWLGALGFYESADYKAGKKLGGNYELVRSWMAHHQGMSLLSVCNLLVNGSIQKRFHAEPRVQATERILHERVPAAVPVLRMERPIPVSAAPQP